MPTGKVTAMKKTLLVLALSGLGLALLGGCVSGDTSATKQEEEAFRNPPKEPPAAAVEAMKGRDEAMKKAQEAIASGKTETR